MKLNSISITILSLILLAVTIPIGIRFIKRESLNLNLIKKLNQENDSLEMLNINLELKYEKLTIKIDSFAQLIDSSKTKTIYIKQKSNEKIRAINSYSNNDLYKFFSNFNPDTNIIR